MLDCGEEIIPLTKDKEAIVDYRDNIADKY